MHDVCDRCDKTCMNCWEQKQRQVQIDSNMYICFDCLRENKQLHEAYTQHNLERLTKQESYKYQRSSSLANKIATLQTCTIHGCNNMFPKNEANSTWCKACKWKIERGICPSCKKQKELNLNGMCYDCEEPYYAERYALTDTNAYVSPQCACGTYPAKVEGEVCADESCRQAHNSHICPSCGQYHISGALEVCFKCFKKQNPEYDDIEDIPY